MDRKHENSKPRILICRLSHIGDCILTLPMLSAIRRRWPSAYIAWAVENPTPQLLAGHPDLDEVITVPKGWLKSPKKIWQLRKQLRELKFDIAVDPQSLTKSAMLAYVSGAKQRVGFAGKKHGRELSTWLNNRLVEPESDHLVDRSMELLQWVGADSKEVAFNLPIRGTAKGYIENFLEECGQNHQSIFVINPGASWPSKRWEIDRFAVVARTLHQKTGLKSVVTWAGGEEKRMAQQIVIEAGGAAILAPSTDLQQLAALLERAEVFIGCDTGPMHLAVAKQTICVGLYGPTRPQDSGAYGSRNFAIQNQYHAGTSRERRSANNDAMRTITAEQVVDVACRALASVRLSSNEGNIPATEASDGAQDSKAA